MRATLQKTTGGKQNNNFFETWKGDLNMYW